MGRKSVMRIYTKKLEPDCTAFAVLCIVICGLFLFPPVLCAQDNLIREVKHTESLRVKALLGNDVAVLDHILADDLLYTHSTGKVEHKGELLSLLASGVLRYKKFACSDVQVRIYGKAAVITGRADVHVEFQGKSHHVLLRYTAVYAKKNGSWQMVAWQSTKMPV